MTRLASVIGGLALAAGFGHAQGTFQVTGTPIPTELVKQNYGTVPKGITAYDLSICNITAIKQSVVSSRIFQALSESSTSLQPIGKQIMLAAILRNQNRTKSSILGSL